MKIFIDTNVVLDVLLKQEPFYQDSFEYIITRNKTDFENSDIPCMSPADFIAFFKHHC